MQQNSDSILNPKGKDLLVEKTNLVNDLPVKDPKDKKVIIIVGIIILILGLVSGWVLSEIANSKGNNQSKSEVDSNNVATSENINEEEFPLVGEGIVEDGGINGEGTHALKRESDSSVALLSTVLSLDSFIGKKVQVWGKTLNPSNGETGWLVDVTKVKVLE